jgi:O-antigen/teichoic acid export membrane protein
MDSIAPPSPPAGAARSVLRRTAKGAGWIIGWRFAKRFIGLGSTLILVRLLTPADFGIASLASGLIQGFDAMIAFGVDGAIIRIEAPDRAIYDAGFTINVVRGLLTSAVMAAAAVPIAHFFNNMALVAVIWVLAASWAVNAFQNIGMVEYRRQLAFDMEFKIKIIPRLLVLGITIPAALIWHSYWALIAGMVANGVLTVAFSYVFHPYRPRFGVAGIPRIFAFSFWEWIIGVTGLVGWRADTVIIGRLLGAASVGIYGVGGEISSLPNSELVAPLCRALFSGFVEEKREGNDGSATMIRVVAILAMITLPLNVGLSLVAYPVIKLGFGEAWLGAVPLVQIFGIGWSLGLFQAVGEALFSAHFWLKTILWMTTVTTVLRLALMLLLIPRFGMVGAAVAGSAVGVILEAIYIVVGLRRLKLGFGKLLASVIRPGLAVTAMAVVLNWAGLGWTGWNHVSQTLWIDFAGAVGLGAAVYVTTLLGLWHAAGRPDGAEADVLGIVRRALRR